MKKSYWQTLKDTWAFYKNQLQERQITMPVKTLPMKPKKQEITKKSTKPQKPMATATKAVGGKKK